MKLCKGAGNATRMTFPAFLLKAPATALRVPVRAHNLGDDLINVRVWPGFQDRALVVRQRLPYVCELGLIRVLDDETGVDDLEPSAFEQRLHVLHAEEADMGLVQQSPFAIAKVSSQKARRDRGMGRVWNRHDHATLVVHQVLGLPQRRPWVVEVFQDVGDNDRIETGPWESFDPVGIVQIR